MNRYFFEKNVDYKIEKIGTEIADKKMTLADFIETYLEKNDDENYSLADLGYDNLLE